MSTEVDGTLQVDGPYGPMVVRGRGNRVDVQVTRRRSVPSLLRHSRRMSAIVAEVIESSGVSVHVGTRRWLPLQVVASRDSRREPKLRLRLRPFSFTSS